MSNEPINNEEAREERRHDTPLFFMRCCHKVLTKPVIRILENKVVLEFYCPYCGNSLFLESSDGLKKLLRDDTDVHTGKE